MGHQNAVHDSAARRHQDCVGSLDVGSGHGNSRALLTYEWQDACATFKVHLFNILTSRSFSKFLGEQVTVLGDRYDFECPKLANLEVDYRELCLQIAQLRFQIWLAMDSSGDLHVEVQLRTWLKRRAPRFGKRGMTRTLGQLRFGNRHLSGPSNMTKRALIAICFASSE